jgi:pimeloyl-ACP methyl ester carboxylesterase
VLVEVAPGVRLRCLTDGLGGAEAPFLLVHGLASNARLWDGVSAALAAAGHPVVAVDLRGHGQSDKPDGGYDFAGVANDLAAVIEAFELDRPVAVGQSWGGNVVVELAARHPGAVRGVACVDGGFIELARAFPDWDECAEALAPPDLEGTPLVELERWIRDAHPDWPESGIAGALACYATLDDGTIRPHLRRTSHMQILRHLWEHSPTKVLAEVEVPVLLVACRGEDGPPAKEQSVEATAAVLGERGRVNWIVADHDVHAQRPAEVASLLRACVEDGFFTP